MKLLINLLVMDGKQLDHHQKLNILYREINQFMQYKFFLIQKELPPKMLWVHGTIAMYKFTSYLTPQTRIQE